MRYTRREQMTSALPPISDIDRSVDTSHLYQRGKLSKFCRARLEPKKFIGQRRTRGSVKLGRGQGTFGYGEVKTNVSIAVKHDVGERNSMREDGLQREAVHS
jgi:hypothetical protein